MEPHGAEQRLERLARIFASAALLVAAAAGLGWIIGLEALTSVHHSLPETVPNSALAIAALALAILVRATRPRTAAVLAGGVAVLAALTVQQWVFEVDLGVDRVIAAKGGGAAHPGRPSEYTAVALLLLSVSSLLHTRRRAGGLLTALAGFLLTGATIGWLVGEPRLRGVDEATGMSITALVALVLLALALTVLRPNTPPAAWYVADGSGETAVRRVMPTALIAPAVLAVLLGQGVDAGWWSSRFAMAVAILGIVAVSQALFLQGIPTTREYDRQRDDLERKAHAQDRRFRAVAQQVPVGLYEFDAASSCIWVNERWCEITGLTAEQALGEGWGQAVHPDDVSHLAEERTRSMAERREFETEWRFVRPDGEVRWVAGRATALTDDAERVTGYVGSVLDITEQKAAEARAERVVDRIAEAVTVVGPDGVHLQVNEAAGAILAALTERFEQGAIAEVPWGATRPDGTPLPNQELPAEITRLTGRELTDEIVGFPSVDGDVLWLRLSTRRLSGGEAPYTVIVSFTDVTEQRAVAERLRESEQRYGAVVSALHEGVVVQSATGEFVTANPRAAELLGFHHDDLVGKTSLDPAWQTVREDGTPMPGDELPSVRGLRTGEKQTDTVIGVRGGDGTKRWLLASASPLHHDGEVSGVVSSFVDITAQRERERELAEAEQRFRVVFDDAPNGICMTALDGRIMLANPAWADLVGCRLEAVSGRHVYDFVHPDDRASARMAFAGLLAGERNFYRSEQRYLHLLGAEVWVQADAALVRDTDGSPLYAIVQVQDVTQRRRDQERLEHLADHDALTGLLNRRGLMRELERQVAHVERYGAEGALLLLDLDHFKHLNDTLGHKAGDDLIVEVSAQLRERLRETDVVARLGGDEFAVILPRGTVADASLVGHSIVALLHERGPIPGTHGTRVTASVGVAPFASGLGPEEMLIHGDVAMYQAKADGRDRVAHYDPAVHGPLR